MDNAAVTGGVSRTNLTAKYLIFDYAASFNTEVVSTIKSFGIEPKRTI